MKNTIALACALLLASAGLTGVHAQTPAAAPPSTAAAPLAPAGLYAALGEKAGIVRLVDDFVERLVRHPRIGSQFKDTKPAALKESLVNQFCQLSGGPCVYDGPEMGELHADMDINKGDFNALVETLQRAMDVQGIAFTQQNRLLALLAPMHRDIITVH
ncbi:MAG: group 1 truncated hemoglobin [Burkholderiaceae bacterium]